MIDCNGYKKAWLTKYWKEIVGETADKHTRPYKIDRDILFVSVDSSVWNQELFMKKGNLIININRKFAKKIVKDVKCQMGHFVAEESDKVEGPLGDIFLNENEQEYNGNKILEKNVLKGLLKKKKLMSFIVKE